MNSPDSMDDFEINLPLATDDTLKRESSGQFFGPYQIFGSIGAGGVARVMRARHIHPNYADRTFALKVLHDDLSREPHVVDLFRREARVLAMLKHINIVETFEAGVQDGHLFIAMEYIEGRDLFHLLERCKQLSITLPVHIVVYIIGEVLKALDYAHTMVDETKELLNLVHRDVNPANVFLSFDGQIKLGDFGVAAVTAGSRDNKQSFAGKIGYFAPEQFQGKGIDQRSDLYAIGVILFEMLCSVRLFGANTADEMMRLNKKGRVPRLTKLNPTIPEELERVIMKALERNPKDRFATGGEMLSALQNFLPSSSVMPLAVASLLRQAFVRELWQELQIAGMSEIDSPTEQHEVIGLVTADERAQAAYRELFSARGYQVELLSPSLTTLNQQRLPQLVLVDVSQELLDTENFCATLFNQSKPTAMVALSDNLNVEHLRRAHGIQAVDILFKPLNMQRVLAASRMALAGKSKVTILRRDTGIPTRPMMRRILLVTEDQNLFEQLRRDLPPSGFYVESVKATLAAIESFKQASYHLLVYDLLPVANIDLGFTDRMRRQPGLALVPMVFLTNPRSEHLREGLVTDRVSIIARSESSVVILTTIQTLFADTRKGRTFMRFPSQLPVEMRFSGRVFKGICGDLSRGGMRIYSEHMPTAGSAISILFQLPGYQALLQVTGRVARVDITSNPASGAEQHKSTIGVEFERFASKCEAVLIAYLTALTQKRDDVSVKNLSL